MQFLLGIGSVGPGLVTRMSGTILAGSSMLLNYLVDSLILSPAHMCGQAGAAAAVLPLDPMLAGQPRCCLPSWPLGHISLGHDWPALACLTCLFGDKSGA